MKHHFVPQFLLRSWAEQGNDSKVELFRVDLPGVPSSRRSPKNTAYQEDLYALTSNTIAGVDKQFVEKRFLQVVDSSAARVRDKLIAGGLNTLDEGDKNDWTRFIMSLRTRQPLIIENIKAMAPDYLKANLAENPEEYNALATGADPKTLEE